MTNSKLLKTDIIIHSILLFLGFLIPICVGLWSLTLSDQIINPISSVSVSAREEFTMIGFVILFFSEVISIIW